jgi:hypothetical protein
VGRVAFKRRVTPLDGNHVFALHVSRPSTFRAPGWGAPEHSRHFRLAVVGGTQLHGSWYLSAIARLQGFSSGSPAASPRRWSPKTVTTSLMVGEASRAATSAPPSASRIFIILAGVEGEASRSSTSRAGRRTTSSSSFWGWKPSPSSAEEAPSSHAGEGELLLPS